MRSVRQKPKPKPKKAKVKTYTIKSGDTLSGIAKKRTGNAANWTKLYNKNKKLIDDTARKRGKSGGGHWIFPGTKLTLPAGW